MKANPFKLTEKIPIEKARLRALDVLFNVAIPFNRWLGMRLIQATTDKVVVKSPEVVLRRNHVGGAHACALALLGEYAAGLLVAQNFSSENYRLVIGSLHMEYAKQGRGTLIGTASSPEKWPEFKDHQAWVEMKTEIHNKKGELVATCTTKWQVKEWEAVRSPQTPSER